MFYRDNLGTYMCCNNWDQGLNSILAGTEEVLVDCSPSLLLLRIHRCQLTSSETDLPFQWYKISNYGFLESAFLILHRLVYDVLNIYLCSDNVFYSLKPTCTFNKVCEIWQEPFCQTSGILECVQFIQLV